MGYSLSIYSAPAGAVQSALGSKDQALFDAIASKYKQKLKDNDEFFEDEESEEDDDDEDVQLSGCLGFILKKVFKVKERPAYEGPKMTGEYATSEELLHQLIFGESPDSRCGAKLGYVFEMLVEHLGQLEDSGPFEQMRSGSNWTGNFDDILAKGGVSPEKFSIEGSLKERFAPIRVPYPDDFPAYGYATAAELSAVAEAIKSPKLDELVGKHEYGETAVDSLKAVRAWVSLGADQNRDIFGFYY